MHSLEVDVVATVAATRAKRGVTTTDLANMKVGRTERTGSENVDEVARLGFYTLTESLSMLSSST